MSVSLKIATYGFLTLRVGRLDEESVLEALKSYSEKYPNFAEGCPVILELTSYLTAAELGQLRDQINGIGFFVSGAVGAVDEVLSQAVGIPVPPLQMPNKGSGAQVDLGLHGRTDAVYYHNGNVPSGQVVEAGGKDLVVIGDVSHGAELRSDGDIYVFGRLEGQAYAGDSGKAKAKIVVDEFAPQLVSIAGVVNISYAMASFPRSKVMLYLRGGKICVSDRE